MDPDGSLIVRAESPAAGILPNQALQIANASGGATEHFTSSSVAQRRGIFIVI